MENIPKKGGWAEETKKEKSAKKLTKEPTLESFEKERFIPSSSSSPPAIDIPEIDDVNEIEEIEAPPTGHYKELDVDIIRKNSITPFEDIDLSILLEVLEPESDLEELDEVWYWNQLFTKISAEINH